MRTVALCEILCTHAAWQTVTRTDRECRTTTPECSDSESPSLSHVTLGFGRPEVRQWSRKWSPVFNARTCLSRSDSTSRARAFLAASTVINRQISVACLKGSEKNSNWKIIKFTFKSHVHCTNMRQRRGGPHSTSLSMSWHSLKVP